MPPTARSETTGGLQHSTLHSQWPMSFRRPHMYDQVKTHLSWTMIGSAHGDMHQQHSAEKQPRANILQWDATGTKYH